MSVKFKRTSVSGKKPLASDLEIGELAINLADQMLYTKNTNDVVIPLSGAVSAEGAVGGDLVDDLTPQLGGNLDTNNHNIITPAANNNEFSFSINNESAQMMGFGRDAEGYSVVQVDARLDVKWPEDDGHAVNRQYADATYLKRYATTPLEMQDNDINGVNTFTFGNTGTILANNIYDGDGFMILTDNPIAVSNDNGGTISIRYPNADGLPNQVLSTDGSGNANWTDVPVATATTFGGFKYTLVDGVLNLITV